MKYFSSSNKFISKNQMQIFIFIWWFCFGLRLWDHQQLKVKRPGGIVLCFFLSYRPHCSLAGLNADSTACCIVCVATSGPNDHFLNNLITPKWLFIFPVSKLYHFSKIPKKVALFTWICMFNVVCKITNYCWFLINYCINFKCLLESIQCLIIL